MTSAVRPLLRQPEGKTLEFKRNLSSPKPMLKTLVAFANAAGGRLMVGVTDDRQLVGVTALYAEEERTFVEARKQGLSESGITEIATGIRLTIALREPMPVADSKAAATGPGAQSGAQSGSILAQLQAGPLSANDLVAQLGLKSKTGAFKRTIKELLDDGLIEYTVPDNIQNRLQKYRLMEAGRRAASPADKREPT